MFDVTAKRRELKELEHKATAAIAEKQITNYGMGYFDATYKRDGITIVLSGRFLYHLADNGRLTELFSCCYPDDYTPSPDEFATLLDGLFTGLQGVGA